MNLTGLKPLSPTLKQQKAYYQLKFCEQYPEYSCYLPQEKMERMFHMFALSDFVYESAIKAPKIVLKVFDADNMGQPLNYLELLETQVKTCEDETQLHQVLRQFRTEQMVRIAAADFLDDHPLISSLERLSDLADALIIAALNWLTTYCHQKWGVPKNKHGDTLPLLVYGMGKLGGKELNFSSDIDLIFAYPETGTTVGARRELDNQQFFIRLGQKLITALHQQTADGFVYRVDMRLRPFGDSGPLVLTFSAMEDYYQEQGRDWERYAMLKARLIGEGKYHQQLSSMLRPFVYRRYIDFSVIDSLRRMKAMIAQEVRRKQLSDNIKLGAGGIREIEFIVQVFQLIRGGRIKAFQQRNLLTVLPLLVEHGEISSESEIVLKKAYQFLRRVENIIQAIGDKQTQTLPNDELNQERILSVLEHYGFDDWPMFRAYLQELMTGVHQEFINLIGEEPNHQQTLDQHWATLWDSLWEDQESVDWIAQASEHWDSEKVWQQLKTFRQDCQRRSIGNRGRKILERLIPLLMSYLVHLKAGELALERILLIVGKVATRTAYLELLYENDGALKHLVKLCQISQWIAEHIAKYPILLDELIDPTLLNKPPALSSYAEVLRESLLRIPEDDLEAQMEHLRQFKQAQTLRIAVADIVNVLSVKNVSEHLTALAQAIVNEVVYLAWQQVTDKYGIPSSIEGQDNKGFAVIGYGKMGGIELGYGSDLDLVFIHNCDFNDMTTGEKQVRAGQFYAKLAQRIMHFFNTRTNSGILYDLDMRLRPSGNSGVLVVNIETFRAYQLDEAWTWEHQALVRARAIFGQQTIVEQFERIRAEVLALPRDNAELKKAVDEMRNKMRQHLDKSTDQESDVKQGSGGLVDIEFIAQYLVLANANLHPSEHIPSDNVHLFKLLKQWQVITTEDCQTLIDCYCQLRDYGHHNVLAERSNMMEKLAFEKSYNNVAELYQHYLK
ncbi:bifunctional [glutamate--ammonia ligase]-adenylyl-L-tyrosine phosphorylase/[glutamate--ammonia-ligase] adenylyltransferase [Thalassotalea ganghwensis]